MIAKVPGFRSIGEISDKMVADMEPEVSPTHNPLRESLLWLRDEMREIGEFPNHEQIQRVCKEVKRIVNSCRN